MSELDMPGTTRIARARDLIASTVDGELFGLEVEQGQFYGFNGPATRIWELLETPTTFDALCETLVQEFAVEADECRAATASLLRDLERDAMVTLTPTGP